MGRVLHYVNGAVCPLQFSNTEFTDDRDKNCWGTAGGMHHDEGAFKVNVVKQNEGSGYR